MEKIHGNTHVFVLLCKFLACKHKNMSVSMYFAHLYPHYIITDKGLLKDIFPRSIHGIYVAAKPRVDRG